MAVPGGPQCSPEVDGEGPRGADSDEWPIEALVMGDGSSNANGCAVRDGQVHASGQARSGHENFHAINWGAEIFDAPGTRPSSSQRTRCPAVVTAGMFRRV